jgi:hypothetical protein
MSVAWCNLFSREEREMEMPVCFCCEKTATDVWGIKGTDDVLLACDDCDIYIALDVWYKQPIAD